MTSTYIIDRAPKAMYGGRHEDYVVRKDQVIGRMVRVIQEDDKSDLEALFWTILEDFAFERRQIALSHGSRGAEAFGIRRQDRDFFAFTHLAGPYESYGEKISPIVWQRGVKPTKEQLKEKNLGDVYCNLLKRDFRKRDFRLWAPEGSTRYLMAKGADVIIIHQSSDLSTDAIRDLSRLFERAILWTGDEASLIQTVGRLRHKFSHSILFNRGSAAIAEWVETAIYRYHGFENFDYNKDKMVDLEALTAPDLEHFLENYPSMINLR